MKFRAHDIGTFTTRSRSRDGDHIVDVHDCTCTCEAFCSSGACDHLRKALEQKADLRTRRRQRKSLTIPALAV